MPEADNMSMTAREAVEIEKLKVEVNRIIAETAKINRERWWYPLVVGTGLFAAGAAFFGATLKLLGVV